MFFLSATLPRRLAPGGPAGEGQSPAGSVVPETSLEVNFFCFDFLKTPQVLILLKVFIFLKLAEHDLGVADRKIPETILLYALARR